MNEGRDRRDEATGDREVGDIGEGESGTGESGVIGLSLVGALLSFSSGDFGPEFVSELDALCGATRLLDKGSLLGGMAEISGIYGSWTLLSRCRMEEFPAIVRASCVCGRLMAVCGVVE